MQGERKITVYLVIPTECNEWRDLRITMVPRSLDSLRSLGMTGLVEGRWAERINAFPTGVRWGTIPHPSKIKDF